MCPQTHLDLSRFPNPNLLSSTKLGIDKGGSHHGSIRPIHSEGVLHEIPTSQPKAPIGSLEVSKAVPLFGTEQGKTTLWATIIVHVVVTFPRVIREHVFVPPDERFSLLPLSFPPIPTGKSQHNCFDFTVRGECFFLVLFIVRFGGYKKKL